MTSGTLSPEHQSYRQVGLAGLDSTDLTSETIQIVCERAEHDGPSGTGQ
jgi:hypothetical protein